MLAVSFVIIIVCLWGLEMLRPSRLRWSASTHNVRARKLRSRWLVLRVAVIFGACVAVIAEESIVRLWPLIRIEHVDAAVRATLPVWRGPTMSDGVVSLNPTLGLYTPECKPGKEKKVLSKEEILTALEALPLRERLIFRMALFEGMRLGEILVIQLGKSPVIRC